MLILHTETQDCPQKFLSKERSGYMLRATVLYLGEKTAVPEPQKLGPTLFCIVRLLQEDNELNSHTVAVPVRLSVRMFDLRS
jgi:hypothetical protein